MSSGKSDTQINYILGLLSGARIALCMTSAPSSSSVATGLTVGGGYTAGGKLLDEGTISGGVLLAPKTGTILWSNTSGVDWVITGTLFHTAGAAHPTLNQVVYWDDTFTINVPSGGSLEIPIDGITFTET